MLGLTPCLRCLLFSCYTFHVARTRTSKARRSLIMCSRRHIAPRRGAIQHRTHRHTPAPAIRQHQHSSLPFCNISLVSCPFCRHIRSFAFPLAFQLPQTCLLYMLKPAFARVRQKLHFRSSRVFLPDRLLLVSLRTAHAPHPLHGICVSPLQPKPGEGLARKACCYLGCVRRHRGRL